jgi:hypothetical protein
MPFYSRGSTGSLSSTGAEFWQLIVGRVLRTINDAKVFAATALESRLNESLGTACLPPLRCVLDRGVSGHIHL